MIRFLFTQLCSRNTFQQKCVGCELIPREREREREREKERERERERTHRAGCRHALIEREREREAA
jgi:hypothetical protein